ncbi:sensor histidine kinase [Halomicrobium salinisoli]|uniref:sensor histidine kinase n=1 Tax=Halomicrobium salinisoli TaxID=2878391 RepID=UPI001CF0AB2C|nr:HAMP domain-containing sensor histidine kinase [Halomicrobium salinisoli]
MSDRGLVLVVATPPERAETVRRLESDLDGAAVVAAGNIPSAMHVVRQRRVDCVVSDYEVPDDAGMLLQGGEKLLRRVREYDARLPFVLFTEVGDGVVARSLITEGITDYIQRDGSRAAYDRLASRVATVLDHRETERRAEWQRRVTETIREVNRALVRASTRPEIERDVCERLAGADLYCSAAMGRVEGGAFEPSVRVGDLPADADPAAVVPLGGVDALDGVRVDRTGDGCGHAAAVPVVRGSAGYGILVVCAARPDALDDTEQAILAELGETIAHAIEAVETREDLKARERELARQNERLQNFASMVSHDLRNPLQVLVSRLSVLEGEGDSDHVRAMRDAVDRMTALIDDVLRLATGGKDAVEPEPVALERVARDAWEINADGGRLSVDAPGGVVADESLLRQLLGNLFRNSLEHAGPDVTVRVERCPGGFAVADDGPGIPPGEREWIFELGYSGDGAGTGYGLAIVDEIADAHGWDVAVAESAAGGARFEVTGVEFAE